MANDSLKIQQTVMDIHLFINLLNQTCQRMERLSINLDLVANPNGLLVRQKNIIVLFEVFLGEVQELTQTLDEMVVIHPPGSKD